MTTKVSMHFRMQGNPNSDGKIAYAEICDAFRDATGTKIDGRTRAEVSTGTPTEAAFTLYGYTDRTCDAIVGRLEQNKAFTVGGRGEGAEGIEINVRHKVLQLA